MFCILGLPNQVPHFFLPPKLYLASAARNIALWPMAVKNIVYAPMVKFEVTEVGNFSQHPTLL